MNIRSLFELSSWVPYKSDTDFPIQNMPFGIARTAGQARIVSILGDQIIDLQIINQLGFFEALNLGGFSFVQNTLNPFIALGKTKTAAVRNTLIGLFSQDADREKLQKALSDKSHWEMLLPLHIGDYTDFYSSIEHATNVGSMFRDPKNALLPNWLHLPVGYHGRASTIVVSGTDIFRPMGQTKPGEGAPIYGPSQLLDFELEMAFVVGRDTDMGQQISTERAEEYIFGLALFNDWSARDIQKWEYVPLGPFLGKNFASTMSPWIVTLEALEAFRVQGPPQEPEVLPYLRYHGKKNYDIQLFVDLTSPSGVTTTISRSNFKYMYWNMCQQLAHHTINGCSVRIGDLYASGTISGKDPGSYGSMLELTWKGTKPIQLADGTERKFLQDGDSLTLRGFGERKGIRIGFGQATGKILSPASA